MPKTITIGSMSASAHAPATPGKYVNTHSICNGCLKKIEETPMKCARCLSAWYHNAECQKKDWPTHKKDCRKAENPEEHFDSKKRKDINKLINGMYVPRTNGEYFRLKAIEKKIYDSKKFKGKQVYLMGIKSAKEFVSWSKKKISATEEEDDDRYLVRFGLDEFLACDDHANIREMVEKISERHDRVVLIISGSTQDHPIVSTFESVFEM